MIGQINGITLGSRSFDITDESDFIAYNDFSWAEGQRSDKITLYTTDIGTGERPEGSGGNLRDYATNGAFVKARLDVTGGRWDQAWHTRQGGPARQGTDAHRVFHNRVDSTGVVNYGDSKIVLTFSELLPNQQYRLILFGNRNGNRGQYRERITTTTIDGVENAVNESSFGADYTGPEDFSTSIVHGNNTAKGYIVHFNKIRPGPDGTFQVIIDGNENIEQQHYINAMCFETVNALDTTSSRCLTGEMVEN